MVQVDFLAANHVRIVGLIDKAHCAVIFAIAQLSCFRFYHLFPKNSRSQMTLTMLTTADLINWLACCSWLQARDAKEARISDTISHSFSSSAQRSDCTLTPSHPQQQHCPHYNVILYGSVMPLQLYYACGTYCIAEAGHVFLIVHNIDGMALRSSKVQTILSMLACMHGLHIVASVDHVNAHLSECASWLSAIRAFHLIHKTGIY